MRQAALRKSKGDFMQGESILHGNPPPTVDLSWTKDVLGHYVDRSLISASVLPSRGSFLGLWRGSKLSMRLPPNLIVAQFALCQNDRDVGEVVRDASLSRATPRHVAQNDFLQGRDARRIQWNSGHKTTSQEKLRIQNPGSPGSRGREPELELEPKLRHPRTGSFRGRNSVLSKNDSTQEVESAKICEIFWCLLKRTFRKISDIFRTV